MCGIFAYMGSKNATNILEHGLQRLEYRGYDSAGIATMTSDGTVQLTRAIGKVSELTHALRAKIQDNACMGIAHTCRATHGGVELCNTHPHHDRDAMFWVVHNGIIENQYKCKEYLLQEGYMFYGQTDTEVVPALLSKYWNGDFYTTVQAVLRHIHGAYGLVIMSKHTPHEMIGIKRGSPLLFGINSKTGDFLFSSDAQALAGYADQVIYLDDGEMVHCVDGTYTISSEKGVIKKDPVYMDVSAMEASQGAYPHFMLKEIYEQPAIMRRIFMGRVDTQSYDLMAESFHGMHDEQYERIVLVGCGTSYNAAMVGAYRLEHLTGISSKAEIASEYSCKKISVDEKTLHIFLSQSGETADSIEVLKTIQSRGGKTFGIVNVVGSTIAHMTDHGLFMRAGYEIGVASTKAFLGQLTCLMLMTLRLAKRRGMPLSTYKMLVEQLQHIPHQIEEVLDSYTHQKEQRDNVASFLSTIQSMFFLGRGWEYPIACEGSLKMKEISYIHSEAYPAGELKHGPLALIQDNIPSIILMPDDEFLLSNRSSLAELQARKGPVIAIANDPIPQADYCILVPRTHSLLMPYITTIVLQLLSYHTALTLGRDIDKPRNLAKSVTVK